MCKEQFSLTTEDPDEQVVVTLPCKHPFHEGCIMPWLKSSGTCPVCRYVLTSEVLCLSYVATGSNSCPNLSITHPMARPVGPAVPALLQSIEGQGRTRVPLQVGACSANFSISWAVMAMVAVTRGRTEIQLHARSGGTRMFLVGGWTSCKLFFWLSEILLSLSDMACTYCHFLDISACTSNLNRWFALE